MNKIILHIGLHKTATKYLQHNVFPFLDKSEFIYNPEKLDQYVLDYLKAFGDDKRDILPKVIEERKRLQEGNPNKTIILSREAYSGNLFSAYKYWDESISLLKQCFPEAKIIMAFRYQTNWLLSCYRESIHEHHYQEIEDFLCFSKKNKNFYNPTSSINQNGYANLFPLDLDYVKMLTAIYDNFGEENTHVYFYENFKTNKKQIIEEIEQFIGSPKIRVKESMGNPNRGYSALTIKLSIERAKILKFKNLEHYVHRPIFFYGKNSIPAGKEKHSLLNRDKYWSNYFLRDNEEVRSNNYPNRTDDELIEYHSSWRYISKELIDKYSYVDWDILESLRSPLDYHFKTLNKVFSKRFPKIKNLPTYYL